MRHFRNFIEELKRIDRKNIPNKENLLNLLKIVRYAQDNPDSIHHVKRGNFIAFVKLYKEKIEFFFNDRRLTNAEDMVYAYFHEFMHAALKHLGITLGSGNLRNIIHDIEVNMYIDALTDTAPELHKKLYINPLERFYKLYGRSAGFIAYLISRNIIKKEYKTIENFANQRLWFLSQRDRDHFIEIEKRIEDCQITMKDIMNEVIYWEVDRRMKIPLYEIITKIGEGVGDGKSIEEGSKVEKMKYMNFLHSLRFFVQHSYEMNKVNAKRRMETVVPLSIGRKEIALLSAGIKPVIYNVPQDRYYYGYKKLNIYIDSSGSMDESLPYILGLINYLKDISKEIYAFDTEVERIKISEIKDKIGRLGGTDIDVVLKHINDNGIINAVIFTDMQWYVRDKDLMKKLEKRNISLFVVAVTDSIRDEREIKRKLGKLVKASVILEERGLKNARSI